MLSVTIPSRHRSKEVDELGEADAKERETLKLMLRTCWART